MRLSKFSCTLLAGILAFAGCNKIIGEDDPPPDPNDVLGLKVPASFDYSTVKDVTLSISSGTLKNVPFLLLNTAGDTLMAGSTGPAGSLSQKLSLPTNSDSLVVRAAFPGIPDRMALAVQPNMNFQLLPSMANGRNQRSSASTQQRIQANGYTFIGSYNTSGVPTYLTTPDQIPTALLTDINASLPEGRPVPTWNPEYIKQVDMDTKLNALADIWITFVHEGAGWRNALGYYTYNRNNPPRSPAEIDTLRIIFPNVSFPGSGGNLTSGSKVFLGRFPANTAIGWFLLPNQWNGTGLNVYNPNINQLQIKYSNFVFNTYTTAPHRQHLVALKDDARSLILLGFEDTTRPGGDNDFNDAIFYVTANPYTAINTDNFENTKNAVDTDGDGAFDHEDNYPNDPDRAFDQYSPSSTGFGSLAFEDLWPNQGDYDFNDLVVDYRYHRVLSTSYKVANLNMKLKVRAAGGGYNDGFGIELPVATSTVQSVSGQLAAKYTIRRGNGTESGQTKAVIIPFDYIYDHLKPGKIINAIPGGATAAVVEQNITVNFVKNAVTAGELSSSVPYNPFAIVNGQRGKEVHLPNKAPTSLATVALLGTGQDNSIAAQNRWYKTVYNYPWGLHMPESFKYPIENANIKAAYKHFSTWAESGGSQYNDWYKYSKTGYSTANKLY